MIRPTLLATAILAGLSTAAPTSTADLPRTTGEARSQSEVIGIQSFMGSCHSCYNSWNILTCTCHNGEGEWFKSSLNLDSCLGNADGWLRWQSGGRFSILCDSFKLHLPDHKFSVSCRTSSGNWIPSFVMLNERIHNSKGYLWCGV
ncbi:Cyanovirin-N [Fusarium redolens]|uniref:Cyanovirin-N n=1 Tax=Fusarium redolens TaxID=48865 RepID=A0A9P9G9N6_FUSRE|nr:Cyanovirin-N [Fusarium redolens]KAH7233752.1 Cyanovirin-N [Fusarium redolens]